MEITTIILLCLIIVLLFSIYGKIVSKEEKSFIKKEELVEGIASPKELDIYRQGLQQGWMHVNVSLYKMWTELDILDFDSIQNKLQQTLEKLASDPKELMIWSEKFKEYLKGQGK